jgi:prepilin-type N-terminal cleavage/methylation domain-containing protein
MKLLPRNRPRHAADANAGFTMIEVMMAMFILLLGMTSLLGMLTFGAALSRSASLRTASAGSVEKIVADLEERLFPLQLVGGHEQAGEPVTIKDRKVPGARGLIYDAVATVNPDDRNDPPLEYLVEINMRWSVSGTARGSSFSTIMLREVPFGARMRQIFVEGIKPEEQAAQP